MTVWSVGIRVVLVLLPVLQASTHGEARAQADSAYVHDPYDLSRAAPVDSTDVYASPGPSIFSFPKYLWSASIYPIEKFVIYAEHVELVAQYYDFFTFRNGTVGLFPHVVLGGETGSGGGGKFFHTNLFGRGKILTGSYAYAGSRGQIGEWVYLDPRVAGTHAVLKIDGRFLRTHNRNASINGAVQDADLFPDRQFRMDQIDARSRLILRRSTGSMAPFLPQTGVELWAGYGRRDFRPFKGGTQPLTDTVRSTRQARLLIGINEQYHLGKFGVRLFYDDRDYRAPTAHLILPPRYKIPGRIVQGFGDQYYFRRDLGYPERGGLIEASAEWVKGTDEFGYYHVKAELQRFFTLFWKDRILAVRGRLEKIRGIDDHRVPYSELVALGGGDEARAYERGFFRGQGSILINVEYRWPIWDTWNAFVFWDESQVFDHFEDVTRDGFASGWGGGIAFRTEVGLLGKVQVGHSAVNEALVGFTIGGDF